MSTLPKVAVLGLGAMGHAFASNLLKNGFTVAGWNRSPARGEDLQAHGLSLHATPQQAVADAEVIISMLADGEATLEVLAQIAPACQRDNNLHTFSCVNALCAAFYRWS